MSPLFSTLLLSAATAAFATASTDATTTAATAATASLSPDLPPFPTHTQERGLFWDVAPYDESVDAATVTEIHVIFSNHLDVGFNSRAWCDGGAYKGCTGPNITKDGQQCRPWSYEVIQANIDTFIPRAAALAAQFRNTSTPFSYMTQPFVVAFLLDCAASGLVDWRSGHAGEPLLQCPNATMIAQFKEAVARGDLWWHAFPHNPMPGIYDASLFNASLRMASRLADDLGVRRPTTYSQRDETYVDPRGGGSVVRRQGDRQSGGHTVWQSERRRDGEKEDGGVLRRQRETDRVTDRRRHLCPIVLTVSEHVSMLERCMCTRPVYVV